MEEEEKVHAGIKFHFTNTGCRLFRQFDRSTLVVDEASPLFFFFTRDNNISPFFFSPRLKSIARGQIF